jgi:protein SCO1/2
VHSKKTTTNQLVNGACALFPVLLLCLSLVAAGTAASQTTAGERVFAAQGVIQSLSLDDTTATIQHGAISNFMPAMTMPFKAKTSQDLAGLKPGDEVTFQLHVTATDSYIAHLAKIGTTTLTVNKIVGTSSGPPAHPLPGNPLLDYAFTNELGQATRLNDFRGQALAVTFFYTRCPLPQFCPRLSKNFEQTQKMLSATPNCPTNWHLISVSFDSANDTPDTLKQYGESYGYDPKHWSFLTGPADKIAELARATGVQYESDGATINHNFRTLIVDPVGHLQMVFPTGGDLSDQIVAEILKATALGGQIAGNKSPSPSLAPPRGALSGHVTQ